MAFESMPCLFMIETMGIRRKKPDTKHPHDYLRDLRRVHLSWWHGTAILLGEVNLHPDDQK